MDSVDSPLQLRVPRDVQVTITSSARDPLQLKFDNSKSYERRANLLSNLNMNSECGAGGLFCFDYLGDNCFKADMLAFRNNYGPDVHNEQDVVLQISSSKASDEEVITKKKNNLNSKKAVEASVKANISKQTRKARIPENETKSAGKGDKSSGLNPKRSPEIIQGNKSPLDKGYSQDKNRKESQSKAKVDTDGSSMSLIYSFIGALHEDPQSKPSDTMKIRDVLANNVNAYISLLSPKLVMTEGAYETMQPSTQVLFKKQPIFSINGKGQIKDQSNAQSQKQLVSQENSFQASSTLKNDHRLDIVDYVTGSTMTRPLEKSDSVRVLHLDLKRDLEHHTSSNGSVSNKSNKHNAMLSDRMSQIDEKIMQDLQKNLQKKYMKSQPSSNQASNYNSSATPSQKGSKQVVLSQLQDEPSCRSIGSRRLPAHEDASYKSCQSNQDDSNRDNILMNLKLLEKEILKLQKKSQINKEDEEYLTNMFAKLTSMKRKLAFKPGDHTSVEKGKNSRSQMRHNRGDYHDQAEAYSPDRLESKADDGDTNNSMLRRGNTPEFSTVFPDHISGDNDKSRHIGGYLFGRKNSKISKVSVPDSIDCRFMSKNSQRSFLTSNSGLYIRQMDRKKLKEIRLEEKRAAISKRELENCTFKPQTNRFRAALPRYTYIYQ